MKRIVTLSRSVTVILCRAYLAFFTGSLLLSIDLSHAQSYTTTWVANTFGGSTNYVGNCARSMWVDSSGIIYTASLWDENGGGIGIYQNGQTLGSIGGHGDIQGCSITGNSLWVFAELQGANGGQVGRYSRATHALELKFTVSSTIGDSVPGLAISPVTGYLFASDNPGNRIRVFSTGGIWQRDWTVSNPGALAIDTSGNVWVAQMTNATILKFSATGTLLNTLSMNADSRPSALYVNSQNQLWVGDQGPDMNIKIYTNLTSTPTLADTYGVAGGYLSTNDGAIKGMTGAQRFTRVVGIGGDSFGNVYVLNNPWGGTWDLGRNGGTDIHCYNTNGTLLWTLQSLNFEAVAAPDPGTDGTNLYSGQFIFTGSGGGGLIANTIDPFSYPSDARINTGSQSRGEGFGSVACVEGTNRILLACGQNPDAFETYYFNAANGFVGIPGQTFGYTEARIRNGFQLEPNTGDLWIGYDKSNSISHYPLAGFNTDGQPIWGAPISVPTPSSIAPLTRIIYLPDSDTMVLGGAITNTDWTSAGTKAEVFKGWLAGNRTNPSPVIQLNTALNPKSLAAAGGYLFVAYVHTVPNIDVYDLNTGALVLTMTNASPSTVYVGTDVDSMYGLKAYKKSNGQYIVTKDNYSGNSVVIHTFTPAGLPVLTGMNPSSPVMGSSGPQTLSITGLNFLPGSLIVLSNLHTGAVLSPAVTFINSSNLTFNATLTTSPHNWSITVTNAGSLVSAPLNFSVEAPPQPIINSIQIATPSQVVISGTNGTAGLSYYVLASTNVALPLTNWMPVGTNIFDVGGVFTYTNGVNVTWPQYFFVIRP